MANEKPTYIYHFTDASNLPGILDSGHIYCKSSLPPGKQKADASHYDLQEKRKITRVKCGPGGVLPDYVPFFFAPQSPMMSAIAHGKVKGCSKNTSRLIYVVSSVRSIEEAGLGFAFTDGHPIMAFTKSYDDVGQIDQVDWEVMQMQYWRDTDEDPDRSRRRMAEFLVYGSLPWSVVEFLAVKNSDMRTRLSKYLNDERTHKTKPIRVEPNWYF